MIVILTVSQLFLLWNTVSLTRRVDEIEEWSYKAIRECQDIVRRLAEMERKKR